MEIYTTWATLLLAFCIIVTFIILWRGATEIALFMRGAFEKAVVWFKRKVR